MSTYTDVSLTFQKHPGTKDVLKKIDISDVIASMKLILLSGPFDSPFDPNFGGAIKSLLFEPLVPSIIAVTKRKIIYSLSEYEPRAIIEDIYIGSDGSEDGVNIGILFHVIGNQTQHTFNFTISRIR